ncbi:hypothetical protein JXA85_04420 [Candidatus Woesearchaeota archaeon]|nr:hypothetical protein [Candidatus Woesearchaeota archaeon]
MKINAKGLHYRELNREIKDALNKGEKKVELSGINGQRFIGAGLKSNAEISVEGVPGNDLGVFMNGLTIRVNNNCQDGAGNTMNSGKITIHGDAGDVIGYAMRNGKILVKGNVGYRVGIHMKEYKENRPAIVIGGSAGDFLGEYMAGGIIVVLNLNNDFDSDYIGTGMHAGTIYIRGKVDERKVGEGVETKKAGNIKEILPLLKEFCEEFGLDFEKISNSEFTMLSAKSTRPYGELYCY